MTRGDVAVDTEQVVRVVVGLDLLEALVVAAVGGAGPGGVVVGELERRRLRRAAREVEEVALADLRAELGELGSGEALDELAAQVAAGKLGPYAAADQLLAGVRGGP